MNVDATVDSLRLAGLPSDVRARLFSYPADLPAMAELVAATSAVDGEHWFPTAEVLAVHWRPTPMFEPNRDCLVVEDGRGMAAMVSVDPQVRDGKTIHWTEGWVRPDRRRQGIGRALFGWAERHALETVRTRAIEPVDLPQFMGFGVLESNPAATAFATSTAYARVRYGFVMRRDLTEPIADIPLPEGIELRPVRPADHRKIWDADVEAFRDHFEPRVRDETDFDAAFNAPNVETDLWRVAWDGDEVVGCVMNQIDPDENAKAGLDVGWLEHVSVRRAWRGRGVASALIVASLRALRERGMTIGSLGVDGENPTGALRLYERLAFRRHQTWITYRKPLTDITLRAFDPDRDLPAIVEMIGDVNGHDDIHWFPTVESLRNEWSASPMHHPLLDTRVAVRSDRIVGAVRHSWREREAATAHRLEVWVHPSERRQGLGRRLLEWGEARARASTTDGTGGPTNRPLTYSGNTSRETPAGVAFAEAMGYKPIRYHFEMRRPLDEPTPDVPMPAGLEIRPVLPEHHRAIWNADEEAFRDHWDHAVVTEDDFVKFFSDPDIDTSLWQIAWDGDEVAGLVINGIYPNENERSGIKAGWLDSVATRRPWRRRGVAGALIARSLAVLRDRGMDEAVLGVDTENPSGALGLYESFGFRQKRTWMFLRKPFER